MFETIVHNRLARLCAMLGRLCFVGEDIKRTYYREFLVLRLFFLLICLNWDFFVAVLRIELDAMIYIING